MSKNVVTLKSGQRSLKVMESDTIDRLCMCILLVFFITSSLKRTIFEIFDLQVYSDLETWVRSH